MPLGCGSAGPIQARRFNRVPSSELPYLMAPLLPRAHVYILTSGSKSSFAARCYKVSISLLCIGSFVPESFGSCCLRKTWRPVALVWDVSLLAPEPGLLDPPGVWPWILLCVGVPERFWRLQPSTQCRTALAHLAVPFGSLHLVPWHQSFDTKSVVSWEHRFDSSLTDTKLLILWSGAFSKPL